MKHTALLKLCTKAITMNEVGHDPGLPYKFSDPDGVRTGKSGWSFGASQFDTQNNFTALECLNKCGFRMREIIGIINQTIDAESLNFKLLASKNIIDVFDREHIADSLEHVLHYCGDQMSRETVIHLVDYHNQFYVSPGGKMHTFIRNLGRMPTPADVLNLKRSTKWGRDRPDDVLRRFQNIREIFKELDTVRPRV